MIELDWEGIADFLDKLPEGIVVHGESKVSIPNTDVCKIEFVSTKQDEEYYYIITDILTVDDIINSMIRLKLTNMLLDFVAKETEGAMSNTSVDYTKEKEAIARVILLLDEFDDKK